MAQSFTSAASGSTTTIQPIYTCPSTTTAVVHGCMLVTLMEPMTLILVYQSVVVNFDTRRFLLRTVGGSI